MPGVVVTTAVRRGARNTVNNATSSFFVVGDAQRGPVGEVKTFTSLDEFDAVMGTFVSHAYMWQTAQTFFEEGGATLHVVRVAPDDAEKSYKVLNATDGSSVAALRIETLGVGAWGNSALQVKAPVSGSGVDIQLYVDGVLTASTGEVVTALDAKNAINSSSAFAPYVVASVTNVLYNDYEMDEVSTLQAFAGGDNGTGAPTSDQIADALPLFLDTYGGGAVAAPGYASLATHQALIQHANTYNRFALMASGDADQSPTSAGAAAEALATANTQNMEHGAMFYPWVLIPYGNGTIECPPEGYVAGIRSGVHTTSGQWQPYAGIVSAATFVSGVVTSLGRTQNNDLDAKRVNAIRVINNTVRIYGARSLATDTDNFKYTSIQETTNRIVIEAQNVLEDLVFSPIDGRRAIYGRVRAALMGIMEPLRSAGALFPAVDASGQPTDSGYVVVVDDTINPLTQLATGVIKARIAFRMSGVTDTIQLEIVKSNMTTPIS